MEINDLDYAILQFVNVVGVATYMQIQRHLNQKRTASSTESTGDYPYAIDQLVQHGYLAKLPFTGRHYSGQTASHQRVVRLTHASAELLRAHDLRSSVRLYNEDPALRHALAMIDVHLALRSLPGVASVETDCPIREVDGKYGIRPDNIARWTDPNRPATLFETELEADRSSEPRLRAKIVRLTRFFRSPEAALYDADVRVIFLWKARTKQEEAGTHKRRAHDQAMNAWSNACYSVRVQMPGRTLPFCLHFCSHRIFLKEPQATLDQYELLSTTGTETLSPGNLGMGENPASLVTEPDLETLRWILSFHYQLRSGLQTLGQLQSQIQLLNSFLDWRPQFRIALQRTISRVAAAGNGEQERRHMESVGVTLLRMLGFPAQTPDCNNRLDTLFPITPLAIISPGENAALTFVFNSHFDPQILQGCYRGATMEDLCQALTLFVRFLIHERRALDLVSNRKPV